MTYTEDQYNDVLRTTAAQLQELQAKLDAALAESSAMAKAGKQAAKLLKDGDTDGASKKLVELEKPIKATRKAELLEKKARIEAEIAELA